MQKRKQDTHPSRAARFSAGLRKTVPSVPSLHPFRRFPPPRAVELRYEDDPA